MTLPTATLWRILKDINLSAVKKEGAISTLLLVLGREDLTQPLARSLAPATPAPGPPRLAVKTPEMQPDATRVDTAIIVNDELEPYRALRHWIDTLDQEGVPTITVTIDPNEAEAAHDEHEYGSRVGVTLPALTQHQIETHLAPLILEHVGEHKHLALARHHPLLRGPYLRSLIEDISQANAMFVATSGMAKTIPILNVPINMADTVILTKNQLLMAYRIALATGKQGEPKDVMFEIVSVLGGGLLFRQAARGLVGLIPGLGILPNVAISYAGTHVIGQAVKTWTLHGRKLQGGDLQRAYQQALRAGKALARRMLNRAGGAAPPPKRALKPPESAQ